MKSRVRSCPGAGKATAATSRAAGAPVAETDTTLALGAPHWAREKCVLFYKMQHGPSRNIANIALTSGRRNEGFV